MFRKKIREYKIRANPIIENTLDIPFLLVNHSLFTKLIKLPIKNSGTLTLAKNKLMLYPFQYKLCKTLGKVIKLLKI